MPRALRAATLALSLATLPVGCFTEEVPPGTQIACSGNSECPAGFVCRIAIGRCVPADSSDQAPPVLDGAALITPAIARAGVTLAVEFKASEALSADPVVHVEGRALPLALDESGTDRAALRYHFSAVVAGNEPQGRPVPVTVDLVDLQGNSAAGLSAGTASFDFLPPGLASSTPVAPSVAKASTPVQVAFVPSEALGADPEVAMATGDQAPLAFALVSKDESGAYTFRYVPTGQEMEGTWQVSVVVTDLAGNASQPLSLGTAALDFTPPKVVSTLLEPASGQARPGQVVQVTVTFDEPVGTGATLAGADGAKALPFDLVRQTGSVLTFQHVTAAGEDGSYALSLANVADAAGNPLASSQAGTLAVDGTAPELTGYTQSGDALSGKDTLVVEFSTTEPLFEDPLVKLGQKAMARVGTSTAPYRYSLALAGTGMLGDQDVQVAVSDLAGNSALRTPGVVQVDAVAPAVLDAQFSPPVARLGITAYLTVTVSEPLAAPPAVAWQAPGGDPGFTYATRSGQAYTYALPVTAASSPGVYRLARVSMADDAGNDAVADVSGIGLAIDFTVDNVPPKITGLELDRDRYSAKPGFDQVALTFELSKPIAASGGLQALVGDREAACATEPPGYRCTYAVQGDEPEGPALVRVTATDLAGNVGFGSAVGFLDFTPPEVFGEASTVLQPALCPLASDKVTAASFGATARHGFVVSEALDGGRPVAVRLVNGAQELAAAYVESAGFSYTYGTAVPASGTFPQGSYELRVTLRDVVGNEIEAPVSMAAPGFVLDTEAPLAPDVDAPGAVVYQRVPWGFDESRSGTFSPKTFRLRSADGAVAPDTAWVVAYDGPDPATAGEIGRAAAAQAAFGAMELNRADRAEVFVASYDAACNRSASVKVRDVEWTATMGYKAVGSTVENPHTFASTSALASALEQDPERSVEASHAQLPQVQTKDGQAMLRQAEASWTERSGSTDSPGAPGSPMVYDSRRGKVVMTGGGSSVWEWDGATRVWALRPTLGAPPRERTEHGLAYDSARGKVVLFGGGYDGVSGRLADTWEWDGATGIWTERTPVGTNPANRSRHAMVYDSARGKVMMFGGYTYSWSVRNDLWEWDGAAGTWTERTPAGPGPVARQFVGMAYDSARKKVVLFGGDGVGGAFGDLWEWDAQSGVWTERPPTGATPPARSRHSLAYDSARGTMVLFSGYGWGVPLTDTWEWDGASGTWTERTPATGSPITRMIYSMAYDSGRGKVVVFGGWGDNWVGQFQDTWEWDGSSGTWSDRTPTGVRPPNRYGHAMVYDESRGKLVLFGGSGYGSPLAKGDTWEWDSASEVWTERTPVGAAPSARYLHSMAYDSARGTVVLFGGRTETEILQDTWEWDGAAGTWTERVPTGTVPSARTDFALAYDSWRGKVVLFGGTPDGTAKLADTWEWDGEAGTWTERIPVGFTPAARWEHAMAFDASRGVVVMFGGVLSYYGRYRDTLEWDGAAGTWTDRTPPSTPVIPESRSAHAMAYDSARHKVVLYGGGKPFYMFMQDTWEWDGASRTWANLTPAGTKAPGKQYLGMAYDTRRARVVAFGGFSSPGFTQDHWEWNGAGGNPGQTLRVAVQDSGLPASAALLGLSVTLFAGGTCHPAGVATDGAELLLWDEGRWRGLAANSDSADVPGKVEWTTSDPDVLSRLLLGSALDFAVRPDSSGPYTAAGRIAVDYAEATLRYRIP